MQVNKKWESDNILPWTHEATRRIPMALILPGPLTSSSKGSLSDFRGVDNCRCGFATRSSSMSGTAGVAGTSSWCSRSITLRYIVVLKEFREQGDYLSGMAARITVRRSCPSISCTFGSIVRSNPQEHGLRRPTWTRESLVETMARKTGRAHPRGDHEPSLGVDPCAPGQSASAREMPVVSRRKTRRINSLDRLIATCPPAKSPSTKTRWIST